MDRFKEIIAYSLAILALAKLDQNGWNHYGTCRMGADLYDLENREEAAALTEIRLYRVLAECNISTLHELIEKKGGRK